MEIIAKSKYIRTSPRKLRLVANALRQLPASRALKILGQAQKRAASPLSNTLKSAIANATANSGLKEEDLKIKNIQIGDGPTYKRFRAVSKGQAHSVVKRTSHITIILEGEKKENKPTEKKGGKPEVALEAPKA